MDTKNAGICNSEPKSISDILAEVMADLEARARAGKEEAKEND